MSKNVVRKKIPVKYYHGNDSDTQQDKSSNKNTSLNNIIYEYPISIIKETSQYEKYKERLILSGKPKKEKILINPNYHHISFRSHSKKLLLNPNDIFNKIKNKNLLELYRNICRNMLKMNTGDDNIEIKRILERNNSHPLFRTLNNYKTSSHFDLNNLYQKIYLNQIERRGFNYNKIKISSLQRNALYSFSKLDENYLDEDKINKTNFILEAHNRKVFPKMKTFYINKMNLMRLRNEYQNGKKFKIDHGPKGVINIKNNPNFKFHVFHDKKGKVKDLVKPCERNSKMTDVRMRDLILLNKIKKVRDPEIIEKFKEAIL